MATGAPSTYVWELGIDWDAFLVQAWSPRHKSTSRLYGVDPEMVVGSNM